MLGTAALIIGVPALAFAFFGWSESVHPLLGVYSRYLFALGGLGAMTSGSLMLREGLIEKYRPQPVKEPALEFLVLMEKEQEQNV